ncbi:LytR family transcriptional regulator, partial [Streptomyces sp. McG7]|nr:LytR family transcriptional regulator [Streptomyces sp. McG7]MBT2908725.1 LytR family transcriptional regulator [Streptomyces sp. McG8]
MNDGYDAGYGDGGPYELVGYDEYGRPVYRQAADQQTQQQYDPYGQQQGGQGQQGQQGYGYDPYATGGHQQPAYDPYGNGGGYGYDPYATGGHQQPAYDPYGTGQQPRVTEQTAYIPEQPPAPEP